MLERTNSTPLYIQVRDILSSRLESGEYKVNDKIPSESQLCSEFGISRVTLRSVLTELVRDGKLYRVQGKGTYVAEPKIEANTGSYVGVREQLETQGYDVSTIVLSVEKKECPPTIAARMGLSDGADVYHIRRLRKIKDVPLSIHDSYIPVAYSEGLEKSDFCNEQLCRILSDDYGLNRASVTEMIESVSARDDEAELLNIRKGYPLIRLRDIIADKTGKIFEYSSVVFRGDKMQIKMHFEM